VRRQKQGIAQRETEGFSFFADHSRQKRSLFSFFLVANVRRVATRQDARYAALPRGILHGVRCVIGRQEVLEKSSNQKAISREQGGRRREERERAEAVFELSLAWL
jgi:hypothetical protein